ncbi:alpha/beta-hydrolase [Vararia minispora EC-137]|uniref:Alpha/beta-hydrolase n=1 Tax=Vararia minispora EC-137 TaxID=1314806 RepID=A0ACB8QUA3_9AGAM|nr:alpha/beta-hydrolase [Vararia minispora EC-137]
MRLSQPSLLLPFFASAVIAQDAGPEVTLSTGTFRGLSTADGTDRFLGIPFAQPPVGALRFKAPVKIKGAFKGVRDALEFGNACPQPPTARTGPIGEDCLVLNVWRPTNTTSKDRLPVLVWVYGGAFNIGSSSDPGTDGTRIITRSVANGKPIIFVSINYRVNTFGFLASRFVPVEDLNAGLQDQRASLEFIQENIAQFGGDPAKVTIWGQSAGAGSIEAHILYGDPSKALFRGAIMDSSTGPFKSSPPPRTYDEPGKPFDRLITAMGCSSGFSAVFCLQQVPFDILVNFSNTDMMATLNHQLWQPTVAPGSFAPVRASARIASGDFLHVPVIMGTNTNEGTSFSTPLLGLNLTGAAQDEAFDGFIRGSLVDGSTVTDDILKKIHELYPANTPQLPFGTGDSLFDRAGAWYGDNMFLAARRRFVAIASTLQPVFTYHFREQIPGNNITLGVFHASELPLLFGPVPTAEVEQIFADTYLDFYLSFVNDLTPGREWRQFTPKSNTILQLKRDNITVIPDDFRGDKTDFLNMQKILDEWEK